MLIHISLNAYPKGPTDNGLALNKWQVIIWTNGNPIHGCQKCVTKPQKVNRLNRLPIITSIANMLQWHVLINHNTHVTKHSKR